MVTSGRGKHKTTQIIVSFSGDVNSAIASALGTYRLATAGKKGSFDAKNAKKIRLRSAAYDTPMHSVKLVLATKLPANKVAQLRINGLAPTGLTDSLGRLIDGDQDALPGGNATAIIRRGLVTLNRPTPLIKTSLRTTAVDLLLERGDLRF
jgi:hypothetical protein